MAYITCEFVARDHRESVFTLGFSAGSMQWSRNLWDEDLENLADLAEARLNGTDMPDIPDWRADKYPEQEHPDLYERRAPGFSVESPSEDQWVVTVRDGSTISIRMTTQELRETVERMRTQLDPWGRTYDSDAYVTDVQEDPNSPHR